MTAERRDAEAVREFRLEGFTLFVIVGLIVAGLAGTFFLGRWYERRTAPPALTAASPLDDPLANVVEMDEPADVDGSTGFFDTMEGAEKQAEPDREARPRPAARATPPPAEAPSQPPAAPPVAAGSFFVQIVAVRDRDNAERLIQELRGKGYPVRLFSEAEGSGALYKVRVGGYPAEDDARKAAQQLVANGYQGAFVTRSD